jgi:hypothetical protein
MGYKPFDPNWVRPPSKYLGGLPKHQVFLGNWVVHMKTGKIGKIVQITKAKKRNLLLSFDTSGNPTRGGQQDFFSKYSLRPATPEETAYAKELENENSP